MKHQISLIVLILLLFSCSEESKIESTENQKTYNLSKYGYDLDMNIDSVKFPKVTMEENYFLNVDLNKNLGFNISFEAYDQDFELSNPGLEIYQIEPIVQNDSILIYNKNLKGNSDIGFYIKKGNYVLRNKEGATLNRKQFDQVNVVIKNLIIK